MRIKLLPSLASFCVFASAGAAAQHDHQGHHSPAPRHAPATQRTLPAQLATVHQATARYADFDVARREGWKKFGDDSPLMGEHYYLPRERGGLDYVSGMPLDFRRPSNLMYTLIDGRRVLTGVSFNVRLAPGEPTPQGFAGNSDVWHVHDFPTAIAAAVQDRPFLRWIANSFVPPEYVGGGDGRGRLAMVHVWTGRIANPDGPFAHHNRAIPYAKLRLPPAFAVGASESAARGLNLASTNGCKGSIDAAVWIANASGRTKNRLHAACAAAVAHLRPALTSGRKNEVNTMAEHAWGMFQAEWSRALTPQQRARIAAITEHGPVAGAGQGHHGH